MLRVRPRARLFSLSFFSLSRSSLPSSLSSHCSAVVSSLRRKSMFLAFRERAALAMQNRDVTGCVYLAVIRPSAERLRRSSRDKRQGNFRCRSNESCLRDRRSADRDFLPLLANVENDRFLRCCTKIETRNLTGKCKSSLVDQLPTQQSRIMTSGYQYRILEKNSK